MPSDNYNVPNRMHSKSIKKCSNLKLTLKKNGALPGASNFDSVKPHKSGTPEAPLRQVPAGIWSAPLISPVQKWVLPVGV